MRRGAAFGIALALCFGAAACGDDGGDAAGSEETSTTTAPVDLTAEVDAFCEKTEELQALITEAAASTTEAQPGPTPSSEGSEELNDLSADLGPMLMRLQGLTGQMLPGDAARFRECAAFFGGGVDIAPG